MFLEKLNNWYHGNAPKEVRDFAYAAIKRDALWAKFGSPAWFTVIVVIITFGQVASWLPPRMNFLQVVFFIGIPAAFLLVLFVIACILHRSTILYYVRHHPQPWCRNCGYLLHALPETTSTCPECGHGVKHCFAAAKEYRPQQELRGMWPIRAYKFLLGATCLALIAYKLFMSDAADPALGILFFGIIGAIWSASLIGRFCKRHQENPT